MNKEEIISLIAKLPPKEQLKMLELLEAYESEELLRRARVNFLDFTRYTWDGFIEGGHHRTMAKAFDKIVNGDSKRLIINVAPRHGKSELTSIRLPAFFLGHHPAGKIIAASHTADLATGFGRKVRDFIQDSPYQRVFPDVSIKADAKAAGRWSTVQGGEYYAVGVGGALAGRGADLAVIDDPHALEISTEIPTPNGFVRMVDLKVGDEVFGPDGLPTKVVAKSDVWHDRDLYRVTDSDGYHIDCDAKHLWAYYSDTNIKKRKIVTSTAEQLVGWWKDNKPILPLVQPVQYPERSLPIDPWVLGAWLGDGTSSLGRMTAHPDDQPYMRAEFERAGYTTTTLADEYSFGVKGLRAQLIELGLLNNKHIPGAYLVASVEQRMALLQGLMDTDGTVSKAGQCCFDNGNRLLSEGVVELLHSLGVRAHISVIPATQNCCEMYRVCFRLKNAARMPRKASPTFTPTDKRGRSFSVQKLSSKGSVQCISVERPDGLFLASRNYIVTHNSEQDAIMGEFNPEIWEKTFDWFNTGPRQRLQPGGRIAIVMTRWSTRDLTGMVLKKAMEFEKASDWEVIELPAILPSGNPLWPEYWTIEELNRVKADIPIQRWMAQYQQKPSSQEGAIIKRGDWKRWDGRLPDCHMILQSWDTAYMATQRSDYSACTTWGVFETRKDDKLVNNIILLDYYKGKLEFPALKVKVRELYKTFKADTLIIEAKAAGAPLIYELRAMGIPVIDYTPTRGNDKIMRANAITDLFKSGMVWAPHTQWADELIEECMPGDTKIITSSGIKEIKDVLVGDFVLSHTGKMRRVVRTMKKPATTLVKLKAKSLDSIYLTPEHPILSFRDKKKEWVKAQDVEPRKTHTATRNGENIEELYVGLHDRMCLPIPRFDGSLSEIDLRKWLSIPSSRQYDVIDDGVCIKTSHAKSSSIKYHQKLDYDFGWILGLYLAEGSYSGGAATFSLADYEHFLVERLSNLLIQKFGQGRIAEPRGGCQKVEIALGPLKSFWLEFGRGAKNKRFPDWFWDAPLDFISGVLDGYMAGDGHASGRKRSFVTVSETLAWNVRIAQLAFGRVVSFTRIPARSRNIMGRDVNVAEQIIGKWVENPQYSSAKSDGEVYSWSVKEKEAIKTECDVYNIEVEIDNSYTTTAGVVHNCQAFPNGDHDDGVDTLTQALLRFRSGGMIGSIHDEEDSTLPRRKAAYY